MILGKELKEKQNDKWRKIALETFADGRDEMNLAEFPLAAIGDRFLDGTKTVVFSDTVWDREKREHLPRQLTISGSDRYGLPTAKDDDILLACIQLSSIGDFHDREVKFSRYELLKLMRWPDESRYYHRLSTSLRRWKGTTVYSDRAFYDNARKSWVNRDFGVFDNLYIYEREADEGARAPASSWFVWNEVLFQSFQAGYVKQLDWNLYCSLKDPVAKRLYRFLDKRFYRGDSVVIDLHELAFNKVRVSRSYNTAQIKRALAKGIKELEEVWQLRPNPERFRKLGRGKWEAVFERKRTRTKPKKPTPAVVEPDSLANELVRREVGPAAATELVASYPQDRIQTMIELYDWHNQKGEVRGAGFLVAGIKSDEPYRLPKDFETKEQKQARNDALNSRKRAELELKTRTEANRANQEKAELRRFQTFYESLSESDQDEFERIALSKANRMTLQLLADAEKKSSPIADVYRQSILMAHFRGIAAEANQHC